jgi:D-alanyl-D-alanine dipeptidase
MAREPVLAATLLGARDDADDADVAAAVAAWRAQQLQSVSASPPPSPSPSTQSAAAAAPARRDWRRGATAALGLATVAVVVFAVAWGVAGGLGGGLGGGGGSEGVAPLPPGFVFLRDAAPGVVQDMRYFSEHNFVGRRVAGYEAGECVLTVPAARALAAAHAALQRLSPPLGIKVYDCYRPTTAVADFAAWARDESPASAAMGPEFFPRVPKARLFALGYIAAHSAHSRGSTIDASLVASPPAPSAIFTRGQPLVACFAPADQRVADGSLDMGTGFDCFDEAAWPNASVAAPQAANRETLRAALAAAGFVRDDTEWWHFTLRNEPFPNTSFAFPVPARPS